MPRASRDEIEDGSPGRRLLAHGAPPCIPRLAPEPRPPCHARPSAPLAEGRHPSPLPIPV
ncbi:hypothetical protein D187_000447 [Cystobacter fuscus DSM 2262]|uniref:Uncharacterized protein n=1 Tax=Cystobacter fuscus (strain ATCC 25194 / DSM 2262 / NBRC 100088 / M29) TaxID=1242864 RepID=S9PR76_CYSF2|nr:hypothetical protein D187_000447 [Cystobacter fuscus DSM 2262]